MVEDPMTSNGVTAALRQGAESAALIIRYRKHCTHFAPRGRDVQPAGFESRQILQ